jgi:hypothetical protein
MAHSIDIYQQSISLQGLSNAVQESLILDISRMYSFQYPPHVLVPRLYDYWQAKLLSSLT